MPACCSAPSLRNRLWRGRGAAYTMVAWLVLLAGCGSTVKHEATQQLLLSDAVDTAISQIDFRPLAGQEVYFDTRYIQDYKGIGFVNSQYITSALRQQMTAAGLKLAESADKADYVVEARIGALGIDNHDVVYGLPANNALNAAATAATSVPQLATLPAIPEIAVAKKSDEMAAAKLGMFAYHRETRERVWQSGISLAQSTAKDTWIMGAGPFEKGSIYDGIRFAGSPIGGQENDSQEPPVAYRDEVLFELPARTPLAVEEEASGVVQASAEEPGKPTTPPPASVPPAIPPPAAKPVSTPATPAAPPANPDAANPNANAAPAPPAAAPPAVSTVAPSPSAPRPFPRPAPLD